MVYCFKSQVGGFVYIENIWVKKFMCKNFKNILENYYEVIIYILIYLVYIN